MTPHWQLDELAFYTHARINVMTEQARDWMAVAWHIPYIISSPFQPGQCVLEIGCGAGRYSYALAALYPQVQFVATDLVPDLVRVAHDENVFSNLRFLVADCTDLDCFRSGEFDAVFGGHVLHHLPGSDLGGVLGEIRRVLAPGGHYVGIEPNGYNVALQLLQRLGARSRNERPLLPGHVTQVFRHYGFEAQIGYFCPRFVSLSRCSLLASCVLINAMRCTSRG